MVMTETRSLADVKAHFSEVVDLVERSSERVVVTKNGKPAVIIMSVEDYEGWEDTVDILTTPGALEEIRQAHADIEAGRYYTADDLKELHSKKKG